MSSSRLLGSSPQARGTLRESALRFQGVRFIPAGAGNTPGVSEAIYSLSVHPRRRGEHFIPSLGDLIAIGSSPQARGTHRVSCPGATYRRFIPAGAGNTTNVSAARVDCAVHPRRRGEHQRLLARAGSCVGSSPQARGTHTRQHQCRLDARFIPAGAGNTRRGANGDSTYTVHPRRRGEHICDSTYSRNFDGSSPQARGTLQTTLSESAAIRFIPAGAGNTSLSATATIRLAGSSPQARGTLFTAPSPFLTVRFIPAGAGNTTNHGDCQAPVTVHPRRRGEHSGGGCGVGVGGGSSPQARGTPDSSTKLPDLSRFIPAGAGNTRLRCRHCRGSSVHPRRRGEHFKRPRLDRCHVRFIPAGAGNTFDQDGGMYATSVHPRRRGEHGNGRGGAVWVNGSSPQARGTPILWL